MMVKRQLSFLALGLARSQTLAEPYPRAARQTGLSRK